MLTEPSRGTRVLATPDGRQLLVLDAGPDDGLPLIFHNGTPGGLVAFPAMVAEAAARAGRRHRRLAGRGVLPTSAELLGPL